MSALGGKRTLAVHLQSASYFHLVLPQRPAAVRTPSMSGTLLLICGFGRTGVAMADAFVSRGVLPPDIAVIDISADRANAARRRGHRSICGDAEKLTSLRIAQAGIASEIIVCVDDATASKVTKAVRKVSTDGLINVVVQSWEAAAAARAVGAQTAIALSELAGKLLARSALLPSAHGKRS